MLFRKFIESDLNRCFVRPRCAREKHCIPKCHSRRNKALYDLAARGNSIAFPNAIPRGGKALYDLAVRGNSITFPNAIPRGGKALYDLAVRGKSIAFTNAFPAGTAVLQLLGTALHSQMHFPRGQSPVRPRCAREQPCIPKRISRGNRGPTIDLNRCFGLF